MRTHVRTMELKEPRGVTRVGGGVGVGEEVRHLPRDHCHHSHPPRRLHQVRVAPVACGAEAPGFVGDEALWSMME